jgi:CheY-like chemotaxis protein
MRKLNVLLVDDNPAFLKSARNLLAGLPCIAAIECAGSGQEALARYGQCNADLVLTDIVMPEMSGFELIRRLRARATPPHVVALSFHDNPEYRATIQRSGADRFVSKRDFSEAIPKLITSLSKMAPGAASA